MYSASDRLTIVEIVIFVLMALGGLISIGLFVGGVIFLVLVVFRFFIG
jgi:hypothetical protein